MWTPLLKLDRSAPVSDVSVNWGSLFPRISRQVTEEPPKFANYLLVFLVFCVGNTISIIYSGGTEILLPYNHN